MKIIPLYIVKEATIYFLISLFIFTGILFTLRVLKLASLIINKGVAIGQVTSVFVSIIPTFLEVAIPLAALLGVMLAFARMSGDSEVIVIRASGISIGQLVMPLLIFGLIIGAISLYVSHQLKPWGFRKLSETLFDIARTRSTAGLEAGIFNELGNITIYADDIDSNSGDLNKVLIHDRRSTKKHRVITAASGTIQSDPLNQTISFHLRQGEIHEVEDGRYTLTRYVTNQLSTDLEELYGDQQQRKARARELTWSDLKSEKMVLKDLHGKISELQSESDGNRELQEQIDIILKSLGEEKILTKKEIKERLRKAQFEQQVRFSLPLASVLLVLIGMPLGIQSPRSRQTWGAGLSALIGMLVFLLYFSVFSLGKTLAEDGVVSVYVGAWLPDLALLLATIFLINRFISEKWQSVSDAKIPFLRRKI